MPDSRSLAATIVGLILLGTAGCRPFDGAARPEAGATRSAATPLPTLTPATTPGCAGCFGAWRLARPPGLQSEGLLRLPGRLEAAGVAGGRAGPPPSRRSWPGRRAPAPRLAQARRPGRERPVHRRGGISRPWPRPARARGDAGGSFGLPGRHWDDGGRGAERRRLLPPGRRVDAVIGSSGGHADRLRGRDLPEDPRHPAADRAPSFGCQARARAARRCPHPVRLEPQRTDRLDRRWLAVGRKPSLLHARPDRRVDGGWRNRLVARRRETGLQLSRLRQACGP